MAKVTAPILSGRARGQIGKTQVYASWKGVQYARSFVIPRNPQTAAQTARRDIFASVSNLYRNLGTLARAPWELAITGRPLTSRNLILSVNLIALQDDLDRQQYVGSPGAAGGVAPTAVTAAPTAIAGEIEVTITSPAAPTGWTLTSVVAFALQDGVPQAAVPLPIAEANNLAPVVDGNTLVTLTGLTSAALHVVSGWTTWTKPDGRVAIGASLNDTATPL